VHTLTADMYVSSYHNENIALATNIAKKTAQLSRLEMEIFHETSFDEKFATRCDHSFRENL